MKFILISLLATVIIGAEGFFFSSSQSSEDCVWLPWNYLSCVRREGGFRKLEERKKIALHGSENCNDVSETRTTQSCTTSDFIASTVLATIKNRGTHEDLGIYRSAGGNPVCRRTFADDASGVKMLGDDSCETRGRRSVATSKSAKPRIKRQFGGNAPSIDHRDVLFLIDESGSVGQANFNIELEFVDVLSGKFSSPRQISGDATRVALTTFSSTYKHHIKFDDTRNFWEFRQGLQRVEYRGGMTCMIDAMRAVRNEAFHIKAGSRVPQKTADGLIIMVTDGCFNCHGGDLRQQLQVEQKALEDMGVTILTFMINVDHTCEESLKALSDGSSCFQSYSYQSWDAFNDHIQKFRELGAIDRWTKEAAACP